MHVNSANKKAAIHSRRLVAAATWLLVSCYATRTVAEPLPYDVELTTASTGYDGQMCWVHARAGLIPPASTSASDPPTVVMTTQKLLLSGSDVFYPLNQLRTVDGGRTWSEPAAQATLGRRRLDEHREIVISDFTPKWHAATGTLLGTGHTITYYDNAIRFPYRRWTSYSTYDSATHAWSEWKKLAMPDLPEFYSAGAGCSQRYDLPNGDLLLPIYYSKDRDTRVTRVTVLRLRFDGETLNYVEHGDTLAVDTKRGLAEPSLTKFGDRYLLTIRHDDRGYVAAGPDGLHYGPLQQWKFDDGSPLGSYNTQTHWVTHSDRLFLVYTRRGADNDHVFRHRAPLFMAEVDPQKLRVRRSTERVLVPERGARLGNFGVIDVSPEETWVVAAEWMQPEGCEAYGSDNAIFVAKIHWATPNERMENQ